ncbi:hypothetical protein [Fimbriimonas ginsengisoli]|uniref:Uncharacterized protein n=1 Tax=Fimbriimonas ginsengisoli Gsoil 348 TaxID=661478 RepID=A0A068NJ27_FIMGI|nr:hypothetical protein [Fimbriimonas ginsengisoli]AIE83467.1 hypothetical protein OP10G_0099 [Fimbriimonas ginsengisoli Gsoil 348]
MGSLVNRVRIARRDATDRRERVEAEKRGPSVQERQSELILFYERYEELVEILCDAAQYGPTPKLARSYLNHRDWFRDQYARIRPFLVSFLRMEPEDDRADAFEALVASDDLEGFLSTDDGSMISRITRTREALVLYGEHLRHLAARTA